MLKKFQFVFCKFFVLLVPLWILFILYNNPANIAISLYRLYNPDIDPQSVRMLSASNISDPDKAKAVLEEEIPYEHDWQVYGMPWYFPTVKEALGKSRGDCKTQAILFASILQNKEIHNSISYSFTHMWVDYNDKPKIAMESADRTVLQMYYSPSPEPSLNNIGNRESNTTRSVQMPATIGIDQLAVMKNGLWNAMPLSRKIILLSGLAGLVLFRLAIFIGTKKRKKPLGI